MKDNESKSKVCSPTYLLMRSNPGASRFVGAGLFFVFIMALVVLGAGMVLMFIQSGIVPWIRNCILAALGGAVFLVIITMMMVDLLSSVDDSVQRMAEDIKKSEEHLYHLYLLEAKRRGKK